MQRIDPLWIPVRKVFFFSFISEIKKLRLREYNLTMASALLGTHCLKILENFPGECKAKMKAIICRYKIPMEP